MTSTPDDLVEVRIIGLPLRLAEEVREHFDELSREFLHLANSDEAVRRDVPGRLLALSDDLRSRFAGFGDANDEAMDEARARGEETLDLTYRLPAAAGPAASELNELLEEADRYCEAGRYLLTLVAAPDARAYRRWYLEQFSEQVRGAPPSSFEDWRQRSTTP